MNDKENYQNIGENDPFRIKHRKRTSKRQLEVLEKTFESCIRPDAKLRKKLGDQLAMTPRAVQIWFQNRRAKVKKVKIVKNRVEVYDTDSVYEGDEERFSKDVVQIYPKVEEDVLYTYVGYPPDESYAYNSYPPYYPPSGYYEPPEYHKHHDEYYHNMYINNNGCYKGSSTGYPPQYVDREYYKEYYYKQEFSRQDEQDKE